MNKKKSSFKKFSVLKNSWRFFSFLMGKRSVDRLIPLLIEKEGLIEAIKKWTSV